MVGFKELCDISTGPIQDLIQPTRMMIHKATHIVYLYTVQCCGLYGITDKYCTHLQEYTYYADSQPQTPTHAHMHTWTDRQTHITYIQLLYVPVLAKIILLLFLRKVHEVTTRFLSSPQSIYSYPYLQLVATPYLQSSKWRYITNFLLRCAFYALM